MRGSKGRGLVHGTGEWKDREQRTTSNHEDIILPLSVAFPNQSNSYSKSLQSENGCQSGLPSEEENKLSDFRQCVHLQLSYDPHYFLSSYLSPHSQSYSLHGACEHLPTDRFCFRTVTQNLITNSSQQTEKLCNMFVTNSLEFVRKAILAKII